MNKFISNMCKKSDLAEIYMYGIQRIRYANYVAWIQMARFWVVWVA